MTLLLYLYVISSTLLIQDVNIDVGLENNKTLPRYQLWVMDIRFGVVILPLQSFEIDIAPLSRKLMRDFRFNSIIPITTAQRLFGVFG